MNKTIVCWIGNAPNHKALVSKLADQFGLAGIVIDKKTKMTGKATMPKLFRKIIDKIRFGKIDKAWSQLQQYYQKKFPSLPPGVPVLYTESINSTEALEFTRERNPDLVIVSGTSLIREPLVSLSLPVGILNLHTGLSPYVKGGPNCTNWCIANNQWSLAGNTILWLSAGIDSGNILVSERVDISKEKDLYSIHLKVMEHAHSLYLKAVSFILSAVPPYPSVPQSSLGKGQLYLTKMWTASTKKKLLKNLKEQRDTTLPGTTRTVSLPL
ncbi:MAG: formyltransferase family protein [Chitinophagaceae bacterium]